MPGKEVIVLISIIVIALVSLIFIILLAIFAARKNHALKDGLEDEEIHQDLDDRKIRYFKRGVVRASLISLSDFAVAKEANSRSVLAMDGGHITDGHYVDSDRYVAQRGHAGTIIGCTIMLLLAAVAAFLLGFSASFRTSNERFTFDNKLYTIMPDSSMNSNVSVLTAESDKQSIAQNSFISIDKSKSIDNVQVGEIVAYLTEDNRIVIHRVVATRKNTQGATVLQLRADNLDSSNASEMAISSTEYLGTYTGYQNLVLGQALLFAESEIGLTTLAAIPIIFLVSSITLISLDSAYSSRATRVASDLDRRYVKA